MSLFLLPIRSVSKQDTKKDNSVPRKDKTNVDDEFANCGESIKAFKIVLEALKRNCPQNGFNNESDLLKFINLTSKKALNLQKSEINALKWQPDVLLHLIAHKFLKANNVNRYSAKGVELNKKKVVSAIKELGFAYVCRQCMQNNW